MDIHCSPGPRSRHHVQIGALQSTVTLYLAAESAEQEELRGTLQFWTNLPVSSGEGDSEWKAVDVGLLETKSDQLVCSIEVPVDSLKRRAREGRNLEYGVTWRIQFDSHGEQSISWLYQAGEDASICFHLPSEKLGIWEDVRSCLSITADHTILHQDEESALVSLNITTSSAYLLSLGSDLITGGATWERSQSTWHTSRSFRHPFDISESCAASLIALQLGGTNQTIVILPVCTVSATVNLIKGGDSLYAQIHQVGSIEGPALRILLAVGPSKDLHVMVSRCLQEVSSGRTDTTLGGRHLGDSPLLAGRRGLGFCSWEALGAGRDRPSLSLVTSLLAAMEKRIPGGVSSFLIDDGWQTVTRDESNPGSRRLTSFDMDSSLLDEVDEPLSNGSNASNLQGFLFTIRQRFPHIEHFGVWVTLAGYWGGIDQSHFAQRYGEEMVELRISNPFWPDGNDRSRIWHMPAPEQLESFYDDYFSFLRKSGITFVKVDAQAEWEWIESLSLEASSQSLAISSLAFYHRAWQAMTRMASLHFGPRSVINCMAFGHHSLTSQMLLSGESHVFRNSQDTFPNIPDSHTWHIYHNALNVCLTGATASSRVAPDADMITSFMPSSHGGPSDKLDWAAYHAAFRACFSSSTIWISDGIELYDEECGNMVLEKLLARCKDLSPDNHLSGSLGSYGTVQIGIGCSSPKTSLPLPTSVFADLTSSNCVGPALKMSCAWVLQEETATSSGAPVCAMLSLWNVRQSCKSVDWVTTSDVAHSCRSDHETDFTPPKEGPFFIFSDRDRTAMLLDGSPIEKAKTTPIFPSSTLEAKPLFAVKIPPAGFSIYSICSAFPIARSTTTDAIYIACVGLIDKYAGLTALVTSTNKTDDENIIHSSTLCRAGRCGVLIHAVSLAESKQWYFHIDGVLVHSKHCKWESLNKNKNNCLLYIVDMVQHLEATTCELDRSTAIWQIDLLCR